MPLSNVDIAGRSCSCSSCFYKTASENSSLKDVISGGSKIEQLFLGKFLPKREQRLLDKLVKTRTIYDDIRNQLLVDNSNNSDEPKLAKRDKKDTGKVDTSSTVLEIVNLVDKGGAGQAPLSDCCSCCSCDSIINLRGDTRDHKVHQHRDSQIGIQKTSRYKSRTVQQKEHKNRRVVQRETAKQAQPDLACACINPRPKKLLKRISMAFSKRSRSRLSNTLTPGTIKQEQMITTHTVVKQGRHRREREMRETERTSVTNIKQTNHKIESGVQKTINNIKEVNKEIKKTVSGSIRNLTKTKYKQNLDEAELIQLFQSTFGIDLSKDKKLDYKKILEKWACDFECDPENCTPDQCLEKKKRDLKESGQQDLNLEKTKSSSSFDITTQVKNIRKKTAAVDQRTKQKRTSHQTIDINVKQKKEQAGKHIDKKAGDANAMQSTTRSQSKLSQVVVRPQNKNEEQMVNTPEESKQQKEQRFNIPKAPTKQTNLIEKNASKGTKSTKFYKETQQKIQPKTKSATSVDKVLSKSSQIGINTNKKNEVYGQHQLKKTRSTTKQKIKNVPVRQTMLRQDKVLSKSFQIGINTNKKDEAYGQQQQLQLKKTRSPTKEKVNNVPLGQTMLRQDKREIDVRGNRRTLLDVEQKSQEHLLNTSKQRTRTVKPTHKRSKEKNNKRRENSQRRVLKTASSTVEATKKDSLHKDRRVVRIGSSISFNIEFYKGEPNKLENKASKSIPRREQENKTPENKASKSIPRREQENKNPGIHHKSSEVKLTASRVRNKISNTDQRIRKDAHTGAAYNLKRCFCTLELKSKEAKEKTTTVHSNASLSSKSMQTIRVKNRPPRTPVLLPYECVPMVCIPSECDPHECLKLIKKRNLKHHSSTATRQPHRSKSTPSQTSQHISFQATETKSSNLVSQSNVVSKRRNKQPTHRKPTIRLGEEKSPTRRGVRVSSTFSFNINLYKGDSTDDPTWNPPRRNTLKLEMRPNPHKQRQVKNSTQNKNKKSRSSRQPRIRLHDTPSQVSSSVKLKNASTIHNLRRCFCTLKLAKNNKKEVNHKQRTFSNHGTGTLVQIVSSNEAKKLSFEKGTKPRRVKNKLNLDPHECEPYFCIPGECNPYQCLERVKVRNKIKPRKNKSKLNEISTTTTNNIKAESIITDRQLPKRRKVSTYTVSSDHPQLRPRANSAHNLSRDVVQMGSSMSFNIQFSRKKQNSQKDKLIPSKTKKNENHSRIQKSKSDTSKKLDYQRFPNQAAQRNKTGTARTVHKNKGGNARKLSTQVNDSQTSKIDQSNKATGIRPILKRCFCTLNLQNKNESKKTKNYSKYHEPTIMPIQIFYENVGLLKNVDNRSVPKCQRNGKSDSIHCEPNSFSPVKEIRPKSMSFLKKIFRKQNIFRLKFIKEKKIREYQGKPTLGNSIEGERDLDESQKQITKKLIPEALRTTSSKQRPRSISSEITRFQAHHKVQKINIPATVPVPKVKNMQVHGVKRKSIKQYFNISQLFRPYTVGRVDIKTTSPFRPNETNRKQPCKCVTENCNANYGLQFSFNPIASEKTNYADTSKYNNIVQTKKICTCTKALNFNPIGSQLSAVEMCGKEVNKNLSIVRGFRVPCKNFQGTNVLKQMGTDSDIRVKKERKSKLKNKYVDASINNATETKNVGICTKLQNLNPIASQLSVVEIRGNELKKNISVVRDPRNSFQETVVLKVIGTETDLRIKKEKKLKTKHAHTSKNNKIETTKKIGTCTKLQNFDPNESQLTVVEISGKELNKNISFVRDPCKDFQDTAVLKVIGTDTELRIKKEKKLKLKTKHAYSSKNNEIATTKKIGTCTKVQDFDPIASQLTVVEISGNELNQSFSIVRDPWKDCQETTVLKVMGTDTDIRVKKENKPKQLKYADVSKNNDILKTKGDCIFCRFLGTSAEDSNKCLRKKNKNEIGDVGNLETILPYEEKHFRKSKSPTCPSRRIRKCYSKRGNVIDSDDDYIMTESRAKPKYQLQTLMRRVLCAMVPASRKYEVNIEQNMPTENLLSVKKLRNNLKKSESERRTFNDSSFFIEPNKSMSANLIFDKNNTRVTKKRCKRSQNAVSNFPKHFIDTMIENKIMCDGQLYKNQSKKVKFALKSEMAMDKTKNMDGCCTISKNKKIKKTPNIQKNTDKNKYFEVNISGKRLKKNICEPRNPKQKTMVVVSGSHLKSEINKKTPDSCTAATCLFCGKDIGNATGGTHAKNSAVKEVKTKEKCNDSNEKVLSKSLSQRGGYCCYMCKRKIIGPEEKKIETICCPKCIKAHKKELARIAAMRLIAIEQCICDNPACRSLATKTRSTSATLNRKACRGLTLQKRLCLCDNLSCDCKKYLKAKQAKYLKNLRQERMIADCVRRKRRKEYDTYMNAKAKQFSKSGNAALWAESVLDMTKLGKNVAADTTQAVYTMVTDPKYAVNQAKIIAKQPLRGYKKCKKVLNDSGAPSTLKRVKFRFASMPRIRAIKSKMESHGVTNFILHIGDQDPNARLKKIPKKHIVKRREPVDFGCSLFMASLRKKPCLSMYYKWPWLYPHLMSLFRLWKDFTQIALFMLAIVVWSPLILCIELSRVFLCCCLRLV